MQDMFGSMVCPKLEVVSVSLLHGDGLSRKTFEISLLLLDVLRDGPVEHTGSIGRTN